jgi:PAS domain S-box-containing protein
MMSRDVFTTQIQGFDQRVRRLIEAHPAPPDSVLGQVLEELATSLEELKVAEEELTEQNRELEITRAQAEAERRRYRDLFLSAPDGYMLTDDRGTIAEANRAAAELLGTPIRNLPGKPLPLFVSAEDRPDFQAWLRRIQSKELGVPTFAEARVQSFARDRSFPCWFSVWRNGAEWSSRQALRWVIRDLTERERARERDHFEELSVRKDEFLAVLAHELRNPLAAIVLASDLMNKEVRSEGGRASWAATTIRRHSLHLTRLVDDLLDVSRVYHGKVQLSCSAVELSAVVTEAVETAQGLLRQKHHLLAVDRGPEPLWVHGDPVRLQQIVVNLLDNAAKYTPDGGRIEVRLRRFGGQAIVSVRDFGVGIAPGMIDRIFGLFEQGAVTSPSGLGIGLTLVRELVKLHGGRIEARSEGVDQGSEFVVTLPLLDEIPAEAPIQVDEARPPTGGGARVLIVDDNRDAADLVGMALEELGYRVQIAYSAEQAQEMASGCAVALIDLAMPDMDGFELAPRLRRQVPDLELFALTGFGDRRNRESAEQAGFQHYVLKPVDISSLDDMLRNALAARSKRAAGK